MTKAGDFRGACIGRWVQLLSVLFVFGCGSTSHSGRTVEQNDKAAPLPEIRAVQPPSETVVAAEQNAVTEINNQNSIFFSLGSSTISQREFDKLRDIASRLKERQEAHVTLVGHANDNGSSSFNLAVADARVQSVARALKKVGVRPNQIKKQVVGGEKISSACSSQACRIKMRRVELVIAESPPN